MRNLALKSKKILFTISGLEKKHKIITYASILFLSVSAYFLRAENQDVKINFATLQERNLHLKENMVIFNQNYEEFPLPVWQKVKRGNRFIIQYINPAYITFLGVKKRSVYDMIGKNNFQLFPKSTAQTYYENDIAVAVTGNKLESVEGYINEKGVKLRLKNVKWREITKNNDTIIYGMIKQILPRE